MQKFNQLFLAFLTIAIFITCTSTAKQRPEGGWLWKISGKIGRASCRERV